MPIIKCLWTIKNLMEIAMFLRTTTKILSLDDGLYRARRQGIRVREGRVGDAGVPGGLAVAGCFLIGCCGSPMLAVWISLFGAGFAPLAKPLVAILTTLSVGIGWAWMIQRERSTREAGASQVTDEACCPTGPQQV